MIGCLNPKPQGGGASGPLFCYMPEVWKELWKQILGGYQCLLWMWKGGHKIVDYPIASSKERHGCPYGQFVILG